MEGSCRDCFCGGSVTPTIPALPPATIFKPAAPPEGGSVPVFVHTLCSVGAT